jgi:hypothetical protein
MSDACCSCNPCNPSGGYSENGTETLGSQIQNLISTLLGTVTTTIVNGQVVWITPCDPNGDGVECFPRNTGEGLICYLLRLMDSMGTFYAGTWDASVSYCKNSIVVEGGICYISLAHSPSGTDPATNPAIWELALTGTPGPSGPPGPAGSGSAVDYAVNTVAVDVTLGDTHAVVLCEPGGAMSVFLPAIAATLPGKWYKIHTNGAATVTIFPDGVETIEGVASLALDTAGESVEIVSNNLTDWKIL